MILFGDKKENCAEGEETRGGRCFHIIHHVVVDA